VTPEPFAGLMTQGMVCHETYRGPDGQWLFPEEVDWQDGRPVRASDGAPVEAGRLEKMSKSKKNVVGLDDVVGTYGADTARLLLLSDSPPERDLEWTAAGIEGAWRYVSRVWRLVTEPAAPLPPPGTPAPADMAEPARGLRGLVHRTIAAVDDDFASFRFNRAVARIRELTNSIADFDPAPPGAAWALREALESLVLLLGPMMPHLAEELWQRLGHETLAVDAPWPEADPALAVEDSITLAVQVNGKLRGTVALPRDADRDAAQAAALADPAVQRALGGRPVRKVIVVPNRVVNVVV
jgi:leucyl-tRNA synthetase